MTGKELPAFLAALLAAGAVLAQNVTGPVGPPILQFSFSNPGARSMGLGGAFVALADDATAAFANPAGLIQISRPEVSVEGRSWSYSTPFSERGRIEGDPTGFGVDVVAGVRSGISSYDTSDLSFVSFVYPKKNWSIAFYRHLLADFASLTQTRGFFAGSGIMCCRFVDYRTESDLEIVSHSLAGSLRITDSLGLGLALVHFRARYELVGGVFVPDPRDDALFIFAPTSFLPERKVGQTDFVLDDSDWDLTAGFLWAASPRWQLGGFYRSGPRFELSADVRSGPAGSFFGLPPDGTLLERATSPIGLPDVYGLGGAFRPNDGRLTLSFEWDRVEYSTILRSLDTRNVDTSTLALADGDELHLGAEYVFLRRTPIAALRLGVWLDPDHQPYHTADSTLLEQVLLPPGEEVIHLALGFGLAFESFQLDVAADLSDLVDTASLSAIYSF